MFVGAIGLSESQILKPYRNLIFTLLIGLNLLVIISVPTDNSHMPYESAEAEASKGHESKLVANIGLFYPHEWRINGVSDDRVVSNVIASDLYSMTIHNFEKKGTKAAVVYTATEDDCFIELPIQGYLGDRAYDENGERLKIERGGGARIRIETIGDGVKHTVYVRYGRIPAFMAATLVSALTIAAIGWQLWRKRRNLKKQHRPGNPVGACTVQEVPHS